MSLTPPPYQSHNNKNSVTSPPSSPSKIARGRRSSIPGTPATLKLKHQPVELDLIDDTEFTSLPVSAPMSGYITSSNSPSRRWFVKIHSNNSASCSYINQFINNNSNENINERIFIGDYFITPNGTKLPAYKFRVWKIFYVLAYKYNVYYFESI
ncbi:hypothetical protein K4I79_005693 [Candida tropicalis]